MNEHVNSCHILQTYFPMFSQKLHILARPFHAALQCSRLVLSFSRKRSVAEQRDTAEDVLLFLVQHWNSLQLSV